MARPAARGPRPRTPRPRPPQPRAAGRAAAARPLGPRDPGRRAPIARPAGSRGRMHTGARPGLQPLHRAPAGSGGRRRSGRLAGPSSPPRGPRRPPARPPRGPRAPPPCGFAPPPRGGAAPPEPRARANRACEGLRGPEARRSDTPAPHQDTAPGPPLSASSTWQAPSSKGNFFFLSFFLKCSVIAVRTASSGTRSAWHTPGLHAVAAGAVFPHLRRHPALSVKDAGPRPRAQPRPGAPRPLLAECAPAGPATAQPLPRRPPRCSCLEDPGDRRACGLRSIGPHSRIRLSDSALTSLSAETPCKGVQRLER